MQRLPFGCLMKRHYNPAGWRRVGPTVSRSGPHPQSTPVFLFVSKNKHYQQARGDYPRSYLPSDHPARVLYETEIKQHNVLRMHANGKRRRKPSLPKFKCLEQPFEEQK